MSEHPRSSADGASDSDRTSSDSHQWPIEYHPTLKPILIWFGITVVLGIAIIGYLLANPELFGDRQLTEIVSWVVGFVFLLVVLRLLVKMYVLKRMTYRITPTSLHREYQLFYRHQAREIPLEKLRGMELTRGRIQTLLGYGNLVFLTGGTNQSLGFVEFENVDTPAELRETVRELVVGSGEDEPLRRKSSFVDDMKMRNRPHED